MGAATSGNTRLGHLPFQCLHISCAGVAASPVARCTAVRPATIRSSAIVDVLRRTLHDDETHTTVTVTNRNCDQHEITPGPSASSYQSAVCTPACMGAVAFVSPVRCAAACGSRVGGWWGLAVRAARSICKSAVQRRSASLPLAPPPISERVDV